MNEEVIYSIIIPAYNEEEYISKTLTSVKKAMENIADIKGELIVVDNNSSDNTAATARSFDALVVFEPHNQISRARNAGAEAARGKFLIFMDADTTMPEGLLKNALSNLLSGLCCGGGTIVTFDSVLPWYGEAARKFFNWLAVKSDFAAGCFIYCLKDAFQGAGGFSEKVYASEEIWFVRRLCAWGRQKNMDFRIISEFPVVTSGRKLKWFSSYQFFAFLFLTCFFPFALRSRKLCFLWYKHPVEKEK
ncbi:MAG: hypothetical protein A2017_18475 [Lentisphaerae bacterium GWF2_44_16]|nr:MAG: hypothetical protein A2017_18475 [Lentisphaerae bacterium GWF2_44_16]